MQNERLIPFKQAGCCALCLILCVVQPACNEPPTKPDTNPPKSANHSVSYSLNGRSTTIEQPIGPEVRSPGKQKFVQIEITKIDNPERQALLFELYFKPPDQERVLLGTFSPFPADNPGKFIVATQGKLTRNGTLILSMVLPGPENAAKAGEAPQVQVAPFSFREN